MVDLDPWSVRITTVTINSIIAQLSFSTLPRPVMELIMLSAFEIRFRFSAFELLGFLLYTDCTRSIRYCRIILVKHHEIANGSTSIA
jgi:hypothetical protein